MRIAREEIFGPVLSVIVYVDDDEAVFIENGTRYGLSTYLAPTPHACRRLRIDWSAVAWSSTARGTSRSLPPAGSSNRESLAGTACSAWKRSWNRKPLPLGGE